MCSLIYLVFVAASTKYSATFRLPYKWARLVSGEVGTQSNHEQQSVPLSFLYDGFLCFLYV